MELNNVPRPNTSCFGYRKLNNKATVTGTYFYRPSPADLSDEIADDLTLEVSLFMCGGPLDAPEFSPSGQTALSGFYNGCYDTKQITSAGREA
jgi:hypothetical protein